MRSNLTSNDLTIRTWPALDQLSHQATSTRPTLNPLTVTHLHLNNETYRRPSSREPTLTTAATLTESTRTRTDCPSTFKVTTDLTLTDTDTTLVTGESFIRQELVDYYSNNVSVSIPRYNRQFRYEERDGKGYLKGRYGFFDKHGKLQVINYSADPYAGFHAEGAGVPEYPH